MSKSMPTLREWWFASRDKVIGFSWGRRRWRSPVGQRAPVRAQGY